jgi:hypothetical protein
VLLLLLLDLLMLLLLPHSLPPFPFLPPLH